MSLRDITLALLVVTVWGANFTVIKLGLSGVSPMLLGALRYTLTALPAVAFVRRPPVRPRYWVGYGLTVGLGQFGCLFYAMHLGMPAGLASVVLQSQALFTLLLAAVFLREPITRTQLVGLVTASTGLYFIGSDESISGSAVALSSTAMGLTLVAALFWGLSNIVVKQAATHAQKSGHKLDMLSLVVWSSLVPPLPFLGFAAWLDTQDAVTRTVLRVDGTTVFAILYLSLAATLFGFGSWSRLLSRYHAGRVASFSLLVPVTGLGTAYFVLGEVLTLTQIGGCVAVVAGMLAVSLPK